MLEPEILSRELFELKDLKGRIQQEKKSRKVSRKKKQMSVKNKRVI